MEGLFILLILFVAAALLTAIIYPFISSGRQEEMKRHIKTLEARTKSLENHISALQHQVNRSDKASQPTATGTGTATSPTDEPEPVAGTETKSEAEKEQSPLSQEPPPQPVLTEIPTASPASPASHPTPPPRSPAPATVPQPAPTPASAPPRAPAPSALSRIPWRRILEAMQLLPPQQSSEDNTEVRLAVWWTTRIGVILAVIASVFLGIYVSKDSPILRLAALGAVSVGVVLVGLWLEKRYRAFGRVVSAGGLGMCFVTAFAASAFETTRVIPSPVIGVIVQVIAIAGLIVWSLWKDDTTVATMALICGYIACAFSHGHDLAQFVVAGLLLLAAAACILLILRRWPAPAMIALGASWAGFFLLCIFHWRIEPITDRPAAPVALACFVTLTLIFQVAGVVFRHRHPELATSRRLRIGAIVNSSLAVVTIYFAGQAVYPDYLASFYLTFAVLVFGFAAWHQRPGKSHDNGLAQTFFLKSMALLALFFVARFDGPVRWLSLSLQTATLVYTWKRHRSDWILLAASAGFFVTIGWMMRDLLLIDWTKDWSPFAVRSIVGAISLLVLGAALAWQADIFRKDRDRTSSSNRKSLGVFHIGFAFLIAAVAIGLANQGSLFFRDSPVARIGYLTAVGLALLLPLLRWRSLSSILSGGCVLIATSFFFLIVPRAAATSTAGLILGQCLVVLTWLGAELVWRKWPRNWAAGEIPRTISYSIGLVVLTATVCRMHDAMEWSSTASIFMLIIFSVIVAVTLLLHARPFKETEAQSPIAPAGRWIVSSFAGIAVATVASQLLPFSALNAFWLAFASLPVFATIYLTRDAIPTVAGAVPLGFSWVSFVALAFSSNLDWQTHLVATLGLMAVNLAIAHCLSSSPSTAKSQAANVFERLLHIATLVVSFTFLHQHLDSPTTCAASLGLTLAAMIAARFLPFRQLAIVAIFPAIFAAAGHLFDHGWNAHPQPAVSWWLTLASIPVAFVIWKKLLCRAERLSEELAPFTGQFATFIPTFLGVTSLVFVRGAIGDPWHIVGYVVLGLLGLGLYRFQKFPHHKEWPALPMLLTAGSVMSVSDQAAEPVVHSLVACVLAIVGILSYGILLTARRSHSRPLSLAPAAIGTALAFWVFSGSAIGIEKLATVCWGVTSILVFVAGLAGGLRNYRLVGLVGLGLCLIRMFIVDIDDTLYRIIAFFVIAVVLLLIGYLYNRFRHLVEAFDELADVEEAAENEVSESEISD